MRDDFILLMVTHNLKQAERIAEDTIFMSEGKIIEHAPTAELFSHPEDERTARYIKDH